jgi:HK97 family phage major capsid protein
MSLRRRQLQDEAATLTAQIEELRSIEPQGDEETTSVNERLAAATARCEQITRDLEVENAIDAKVKALRSVVVDACESRSVIESTEKKEPAAVNVRHFASTTEARSAGLYLRGLARGEFRAMGETSPTYDEKGAELVPAELYGTIINVMNRQSVAARVAFVVNTISNRITLPKLGDATAAFYAEAAEGTLTDIATEGVTVNLFGIRSLSAISNDLIEDSVVDVASMFAGACGNAFAAKVDYAWLQGDVTAGIDGLVGEVDQEVLVASASATTAEKLAELVGKIDPLAANTAWVVSPAGYGAILAANAATGAAMLADAMAPTVFGRPVYVTTGLPSGTLALFGDFSMASAVAVKAAGLRVEALRETRAIYDQTVFVGKQRIGVANHAPQYVAKLVID